MDSLIGDGVGIQVSWELLGDVNLSASEKLVMMYLTHIAEEGGSFNVTIPSICGATGMHHSTIRSALQSLTSGKRVELAISGTDPWDRRVTIWTGRVVR